MALDEHGHREQDAFEDEGWLCDECGKENTDDSLMTCDYCGAERP